MAGPVTLDCPAKVNLALAVDPPQPNDPRRLHPIASWMAALSFADTLTVERVVPDSESPGESSFELAYAPDAPVPGAIDWALEDDLMFRAHALVEQRMGRPLAVRVELQKRIPTGAGLGGGSSDAAGMIVALDRLFELGLNASDQSALAAELGSDVHFALGVLAGQTSSIVTGTGDQVEPAPCSATWPIHLVLILPPFGCPTGAVYAAFDRLNASKSPINADDIRELARGFTPGNRELFNDLTAAAADVQPRLKSLLEDLGRLSPRPVHVTGSGAACFAVTDSADDAEGLAQVIRDELNVAALSTQTI
ncbi:4-(cytidine 5'-diphospho)-2-C-methyl-D-erythritol kinase [Algisphaera agarilytica]|uniref:4-diphosphocytidyl-2-C-methyl-D-erythritol kinase n=1 Tax=Algisphaera agarilytica TaxID=1385975 RepID=A0A7X0H961_9BACT|nr:hypothetical protein [Algisphaera agarilytica]MBB6431531.1 4-diphosphocytidyl-2-C-methyl-D-erythritol kinase [Algisphaera agarilytica]